MDDEKIIELFFERSEQAIVELDSKYGKLCHNIAANILNNRQDAEECVNDAYLGVWNTIPPERPNHLLSFICKIVRNLSIMRHHANTAVKRNSTYDVALDELVETLASPTSVEDEIEAKQLAGIIENFLDTLSAENRVIFMRRYWFCQSYTDIARQVGITEKNVSVHLTRIRKQLRNYLLEKAVIV